MALRFNKRVKIAPGIKLNVSRSGLSTTVGPKGASVNIGKKGTYLNTGLPGTGLSARTKIADGPKSTPKPMREVQTPPLQPRKSLT
ncbi:uncharacterized protein DUF4236 [Rhodobacter aestuarii]|uniref:DUF4236 domain-containing protein n=2 Tax=Rhodobacter aestuarii TaxID=453582 RepID=A0A1N7KHI7_9RHOB|nr:uncharacterized protein DUF4236 [Rhodobacter aestuarii]SIS61062.1 Protein of unknown function [Rhodobacter aestuarii]